MMLDLFTDIPLLSLFVKFMVASTLMLGTMWALEKIGLLKAPDLAELGWKLAIAGSFLALLPVGDWLSNPITIAHERTAELAQEFNEGRPFATMTDKSTAIGQPVQKAVIQGASAPMTPTPQPETISENAGLSADISATAHPRKGQDNNTIPSTPGTSTQSPVTDSEETIINVDDSSNGLIDILATLRTKDIALMMWAGLALMATFLLLGAYATAVRGLGSRKRVDAEHHANQALRSICADVNIKHVPYLSRSSDIKSPVCLPRREICLPDWTFDDMPEGEFKSLLAHEIAHMLRRDPLMLMVLQILTRLFFFQPLFLLARKRLTDLAELAADEWAAKQIADARAVAAALYTCATKIQENRQIQWGLAMAGNKSMLRTRVERLIGSDTAPFKNTSRTAKAAMIGGMLTVTLGLPSIQFATALSVEHPNFGFYPEPDRPEAEEAQAIKATIPTVDEVWAQLQADYEAERQVAVEQQQEQLAMLAERAKAKGWTPEQITEMMERIKVSVDLPELENLVTMAEYKDLAEVTAITNHPHPFDEETREEIAATIAEATAEAEAAALAVEAEIARNAEHFERIGEEAARAAEEATRDLSISSMNGSGHITWQKNDYKTKIRWDGEFDLSDDDRSIARMDDEAELEIRTRGDGPRRKIRFEGHDDKIEITYWVDGRKAELDKAGKKWMGDTLLMLTREMGFNAEKRVARILKKDGVKGIFNEMKQIESDYVFGLYTRHLTDQAELSRKELTQLVKMLSRLDGDYGKRLALLSLLDQKALDAGVLPHVMDVAKGIDSDYELRLLLTPYIARFGLTEKEAKSLLEIAKSIDSDYEMRLLLTAAFNDKDISKGNLERLTELAASQIESDYEFRLLLSAFVDQFGKSREATEIAIEAIGTIDSDYEKRLALSAITDNGLFNNKSWVMAIEAAASISSDYEKRLALNAIKRRLPKDKRSLKDKHVQKALKEAVESISSDYERKRVAEVAPVAPAPAAQTITTTATADVEPDTPKTVTVSVAAPKQPEKTVRTMTMTTTASVAPNVPQNITTFVTAPKLPKTAVRTLTATTTANVKPGVPHDMTVTVVAPNYPE